MGSNVHFHYQGEGPFKAVPESLGSRDTVTLPRYTGGGEFMEAVYAVHCKIIPICSCPENNHSYFCSHEAIYRPANFDSLRKKTKHLPSIWQEVIDYLESEPGVYIEYD